jgi:tetratricopeptide (TPR) repeat protein
MREAAAHIDAGRRAYAQADWATAWDHLRLAHDESSLEPDDILLLARSAWWLGNVPDALAFSENAYQALLAARREVDAAETALHLSLLWLTRGDMRVGDAWRTRARRILDTQPEGRLHGYLLYLETSMALVDDGQPWADAAVERIGSLAAQYADPVLRSLSLVVNAMSRLRRGDTAEGFALLDEAMLPVLAGQLPGEWAGDVYCTTIHLCHELADLRRMQDWTSATESWCRDFGSDAIYTGVCRVHRLEMLSARGEWADVEERLARESGSLLPANGWIAGGGFYQLGEIRRLRGDRVGALEAFSAARDAYIDPEPGYSLLLLGGGDAEGARETIAQALSIADDLGRVRKLRAAVEIAVAADRVDQAEQWCAELTAAAERYASPGFRAWACHARGILASAHGEPDAAATELRQAIAAYRRDRLPYDMAHASTWLACVHEQAGNHAAASRARADASTILARLGAEDPIPTHLPVRVAIGTASTATSAWTTSAAATAHTARIRGARADRRGREQPRGRGSTLHQREDDRSTSLQCLHQARCRLSHRSRGVVARLHARRGLTCIVSDTDEEKSASFDRCRAAFALPSVVSSDSWTIRPYARGGTHDRHPDTDRDRRRPERGRGRGSGADRDPRLGRDDGDLSRRQAGLVSRACPERTPDRDRTR